MTYVSPKMGTSKRIGNTGLYTLCITQQNMHKISKVGKTCYNLIVVSIRVVMASLTKVWDCCKQRRTAQDDIDKVANLYPAVCGFTEQL